MIPIYQEIFNRIQKIDFTSIFPGFYSFEFALYNKKTVYFQTRSVNWNEHFIGNTAIEWEGKYIAIWNLEYIHDDLDVFTSKIIHEMFHAYQMTNQESRFPNEIRGLDYDYHEELLRYKLAESKILVQSYQSLSIEDFKCFLSLRKYRYKQNQNNIEYESKIECVEGCAVYVEWQALKQLSEAKFQDGLEREINSLYDLKSYLPIRRISYTIGALYLLVSDALEIDLDKTILDNSTPFDIQLLNQFPSIPNIMKVEPINPQPILDYYQNIQLEIEETIEKSSNHFIFETITGLDPMNTKKIENQLLASHFLRVHHQGKDRFIFGKSVAIYDENTKQYQLYYDES